MKNKRRDKCGCISLRIRLNEENIPTSVTQTSGSAVHSCKAHSHHRVNQTVCAIQLKGTLAT